MMDDEDLLQKAVEELLRYHTTSALATKRVAIEDLLVSDVVSSKAHKCTVRVHLCIGIVSCCSRKLVMILSMLCCHV
eukprot:14148-Heterococcus_DN1.PRE.3